VPAGAVAPRRGRSRERGDDGIVDEHDRVLHPGERGTQRQDGAQAIPLRDLFENSGDAPNQKPGRLGGFSLGANFGGVHG
jgi:hypothetical protein